MQHDDLEKILSAFLVERGRISDASDVPLHIAEADGRNAARALYPARSNPYRQDREAKQHEAWLRGFKSIEPKPRHDYSYQQEVRLFVN